MDLRDSDAALLSRLDGLIAETMQRCASFERLVATTMAAGLDATNAEAVLAASYHSLQMFRKHLAEVEARMAARSNTGM